MSTKMSARGIVGSLRVLGVTAAVAAGIAGFATVGQTDAMADSDSSRVPAHVCQTLMDHAPAEVVFKLRCVVIADEGPIEGSILS
jgi:hypothetical protein